MSPNTEQQILMPFLYPREWQTTLASLSSNPSAHTRAYWVSCHNSTAPKVILGSSRTATGNTLSFEETKTLLVKLFNFTNHYLVQCSRRRRHIHASYTMCASHSSRCCCTPRWTSRCRHTVHSTARKAPLPHHISRGVEQHRQQSPAGDRPPWRRCCSSRNHR